MDFEIKRIWGELRRILGRLTDLDEDAADHEGRISTLEAEIEKIKGAMRSERAKRGWATRRRRVEQATVAELMRRVDRLEQTQPEDFEAAEDMLDQIEMATRQQQKSVSH